MRSNHGTNLLKGTKLYRNRYTLEDEIGSGGFAKIYRASEQDRYESVAIKVASNSEDPSYAKSLREEAKIIRRFDHQNIVRLQSIPRMDKDGELIYANAIELIGNPVFFVMEYLAGGTLEEYLKYVKQLSVPEAAEIGLQVARGLNYMHQRGYAHNDLKLENIVFRKPIVGGQPFLPVLIDFGIATRIQQPSAGSLYIMSPEMVARMKGDRPPEIAENVDRAKGDVWSIGVILYRMLGGQLPFSGRTERSVTQQIYRSRPTALQRLAGEIPKELDKLVIDGCLAKEPEHRIGLLELGQWLSEFVNGDVVASQSADKGKANGIFGRLLGR